MNKSADIAGGINNCENHIDFEFQIIMNIT
jgi:hypothetical protein